MVKGSKMSLKAKLRLSETHKGENHYFYGKHLSKEAKQKLSEAHKGQLPWNKGKPPSGETRRKISEALKGKRLSEEHKKKIGEAKKGEKNPCYGKHLSKETKRKMSDSIKGKKSCHWKGGITPTVEIIRKSLKYQQWHSDVFIRDNFTCQKCGEKGCYLEVHHKKPFSKFINEVKKCLPLLNLQEGAMVYTPLWDTGNGVTLCKTCHLKTRKNKS